MGISWGVFRDTIVIDQAFEDELVADIAWRNANQSASVPPKTTLAICARRVTVAPGFTFNLGTSGHLVKSGRLAGPYHLLIIADIFDGASGIIDTSGADGHHAVPAQARHGTTHHPKTGKGESGTDGTDGSGGDGATSITVCFQRAVVADPGGVLTNLRAQGGRGGRGGWGGDGAAGGDNVGGVPGPGGDGGDAGKGSSGGMGGTIHVIHVDDLSGAINAVNAGGPRGDHGNPGKAGDGNPPGQPGASQQGIVVNGAAGPPVTPQQLSPQGFWDHVRQEIGHAAETWAQHRVRSSTYRFRRFEPGDTAHDDVRAECIRDLQTVKLLAPGGRAHADAEEWLSRILLNLNPLGLPYGDDVIASFPEYERVVTDYAALIQAMFIAGTNIFTQQALRRLEHAQLEAQIASIEGSIDVFGLEQERVTKKLDATRAEVNALETQRSRLEQSIKDKQAELEKEPFNIAGIEPTDVAAVAAGVVAVVGTGGAAVAVIGAAVAAGTELNALAARDWKQTDKLKAEVSNVSRGAEDFVNNAGVVYEQYKILAQTEQAGLKPEHQALIADATRVSFDLVNAKVRRDQAALEQKVVQLRLDHAKEDLARAEAIKRVAQADNALLAELGQLLIRRAQGYVDILMKYIFWAARAVDIYTQQPRPVTVAFDYGYVDPDREADAYARLARGDLSLAAELARAYVASWSRLPDILYFRDVWETYRLSGDLVHDVLFVDVDDPLRIAEFRQGRPIGVTVQSAQLPPSRSEDKVEGVMLCLEGATTRQPGATCVIEHAGDWSIRRRGEGGAEPEHAFGRRRRAVLLASTSTETFTHEVFCGRQRPVAFWGRGVQTGWRIILDQGAGGDRVDLSKLTRIRIAVAYASFLSSTPLALPNEPTTQLGSSPNPSSFGEPVTLTATVTSPDGEAAGSRESAAAPGSSGGPPSAATTAAQSPSDVRGDVTFTAGTKTLGTVALEAGTAALSTSELAVGAHRVVAAYQGDGVLEPSQGSVEHRVERAQTSIDLTPRLEIRGQTPF